jgi:hypothetical protein
VNAEVARDRSVVCDILFYICTVDIPFVPSNMLAAVICRDGYPFLLICY